LKSGYFELSDAVAFGALRALLTGASVLVGHNLKFDLQKALLSGLLTRDELDRYERLDDTQTVFHLLDENSPKGLKVLATSVLKYDDAIPVVIKSGKNKGSIKYVPKEKYTLDKWRRKFKLTQNDGYHLLPRHVVVPYALRDTEFTLLLYEKLWPELERKGEDVLAWYRTEMQLVLDLLDMEADGLALDIPYLDETTSEWGVRVMESLQQLVMLTGKADFNPASNPQLAAAFKARGFNLPNTQRATLQELDDELARALLKYRGEFKVYKTYLRAMQHDQRDGVIHPNFNPVKPKTGRLSSGSAEE
jgi:DNA polymerase I-like protein with 3'-5' exonuclease and polymerase domains